MRLTDRIKNWWTRMFAKKTDESGEPVPFEPFGQRVKRLAGTYWIVLFFGGLLATSAGYMQYGHYLWDSEKPKQAKNWSPSVPGELTGSIDALAFELERHPERYVRITTVIDPCTKFVTKIWLRSRDPNVSDKLAQLLNPGNPKEVEAILSRVPKSEALDPEHPGAFTVGPSIARDSILDPKGCSGRGAGVASSDTTDLSGVRTAESFLSNISSWLIALLPTILIFGAGWYLFNRLSKMPLMSGVPAGGGGKVPGQKEGPLADVWLPDTKRFDELPRLREVKGLEPVVAELRPTLEFMIELGQASRAEKARLEEEHKKSKGKKPLGKVDLRTLKLSASPLGETAHTRFGLHGKPGGGKTMIARAMAREAGVPCLVFDLARLHDTFIGVGARHANEMFEEMAAHAPCIAVWDEVDSIGSRNDPMLSDQKREVINVLLKALDGFDQSRLFGVCLLGMTNEIKLLDPAFLRPGRFHPQIEVPEPDIDGIAQIFESHIEKAKIKLAADVRLNSLFSLFIGETGATIAGCVKEAKLVAAREWKAEERRLIKKEKKTRDEAAALLQPLTFVGHAHLVEGFMKTKYGLKKPRPQRPDTWAVTVVHEGLGHACVQAFLCSEFYKKHPEWHKWMTSLNFVVRLVATGEPRTKSLGMVIATPEHQIEAMTHLQIWGRAAMGLAGGIAQQVVFGLGAACSGQASDLDQVTKQVHQAITQLGASARVGRLMIGKEGYSSATEIGPDKKKVIDDEVLLRVKLIEAMSWWIISTMARSEKLHEMLLDMQTSRVMFEEGFYQRFADVMCDVEANWEKWQPKPLETLLTEVKSNFLDWSLPDQSPEAQQYLAPKAAKLLQICETAYAAEEVKYRNRLAEEAAEFAAEEAAKEAAKEAANEAEKAPADPAAKPEDKPEAIA